MIEHNLLQLQNVHQKHFSKNSKIKNSKNKKGQPRFEKMNEFFLPQK